MATRAVPDPTEITEVVVMASSAAGLVVVWRTTAGTMVQRLSATPASDVGATELDGASAFEDLGLTDVSASIPEAVVDPA